MSKQVGAMRAKDAKNLPVGAFVEGELYLSWMHFSKPILAFYSYFLFFYSLLFFFFKS
jgi:hypothetical protein